MGVNTFMPHELIDQFLGLERKMTNDQSMLGDERSAMSVDESAGHTGHQVASRDNAQRIDKMVDDDDDCPCTTMQAQPAIDHAQIHPRWRHQHMRSCDELIKVHLSL